MTNGQEKDQNRTQTRKCLLSLQKSLVPSSHRQALVKAVVLAPAPIRSVVSSNKRPASWQVFYYLCGCGDYQAVTTEPLKWLWMNCLTSSE